MQTYKKIMFKGERGFTLTEVIVFIVIIAITMIPLTRLVVENSGSTGRFVRIRAMNSYAGQIMEEILGVYASKSLGYDWIRNNLSGIITQNQKMGLMAQVEISEEITENSITYVVLQVSVSGAGEEDLTLSTLLVKNLKALSQ